MMSCQFDCGSGWNVKSGDTHLCCVISWNATERTWDCPCHGSRFDPQGKVLHGPAIAGLKKKSR
jgi:nitrite reductase/ring-hydroxylating ferredoxin subunit